MKLTKKELKELILYTVVLIFAFIYIRELLGILSGVIKWFMPFIIGLCIAFVLNVLVNVIENKWLGKCKISEKSKRAISLCGALSIIIGFFIFLSVLIIPSLRDTIAIFANNIPAYSVAIRDWLEKLRIDPNTISSITESIRDLGEVASGYIRNNSELVIETTLGVATNVVTWFVNIFIGFVFAIYYLAQKERITKQVGKIMDAYLPKKAVNKIKDIGSLSNKVFSKFVSGQCLEAIIIGVLCFIGMIILRLPYATTISILVGFTALIPVFGAFIGTIVGAFLIFMINPIQAIIFVIFILVLQQFEGNLIYPKVVGKSVGLPGIWVLVAVTVGASINGIVGMFLSVPIASILYSILATNVNYRLKEKEE